MKIVRVEDLHVGDTIRVGDKKFNYPSVTKIEKRNDEEIWTEWSDGVRLSLPPWWDFKVLEDNDERPLSI